MIIISIIIITAIPIVIIFYTRNQLIISLNAVRRTFTFTVLVLVSLNNASLLIFFFFFAFLFLFQGHAANMRFRMGSIMGIRIKTQKMLSLDQEVT